MVHMPGSTLRICEQRYKVVAPATTPTGHRLHSTDDVQRLALLQQLTDHRHAIGAIAALSAAQLPCGLCSTSAGSCLLGGAAQSTLTPRERARQVRLGSELRFRYP